MEFIEKSIRRILVRKPFILLGFALAYFFIHATTASLKLEFWRDEAWTLMAVDTPPFYKNWMDYYREHIATTGAHPPLFYAITLIPARLIPNNPRIWRLMCVISSTLGIILLYKLAKQWKLRKAGLMAAILLSFNPQMIVIGSELRSYSFLFLIAILMALQIKPLIEKKIFAKSAILLFTFSLIGLFFHYIFIFLLLAFMIFFAI